MVSERVGFAGLGIGRRTGKGTSGIRRKLVFNRAGWQENLFNSEDLLRVDWYRLQSMLEQQMVVGTKYENRPVNIAKLTDGEKVFLVREPENIYDANAIEVRSENWIIRTYSRRD